MIDARRTPATQRQERKRKRKRDRRNEKKKLLHAVTARRPPRAGRCSCHLWMACRCRVAYTTRDGHASAAHLHSRAALPSRGRHSRAQPPCRPAWEPYRGWVPWPGTRPTSLGRLGRAGRHARRVARGGGHRIDARNAISRRCIPVGRRRPAAVGTLLSAHEAFAQVGRRARGGRRHGHSTVGGRAAAVRAPRGRRNAVHGVDAATQRQIDERRHGIACIGS